MTLSHQRLSMQLVLAAVRHLKSSMCFSALINQGIAETNLKTKNIHRVERKTISALQSCHFYRILMLRSSFAWRQHRAAQQWDCLCVDRARDVTAQPQGCAGRAKAALTPCHAQPRAMQHGAGAVKKQRPALCCLQVQTDLYLVKNLIHTFTEKNYRMPWMGSFSKLSKSPQWQQPWVHGLCSRLCSQWGGVVPALGMLLASMGCFQGLCAAAEINASKYSFEASKHSFWAMGFYWLSLYSKEDAEEATMCDP